MVSVVSDGIPPAEFARRARQRSQQNTLARANRYAGALRASAQDVLGRQGTGRWYRLPGRGQGLYQASKPGEPPALRTGALRRSARVKVGGLKVRGQGWEVPVTLGFGVPYAEKLDPSLVGGTFAHGARQREIRRFILADAQRAFRRIQRETRS